MAHHRPTREITKVEIYRRDLIQDVGVLLRRWHRHKARARLLTPQERQAWATEAANLLEALSSEVEGMLPLEDNHSRGARMAEWRRALEAGLRFVRKIPDD